MVLSLWGLILSTMRSFWYPFTKWLSMGTLVTHSDCTHCGLKSKLFCIIKVKPNPPSFSMMFRSTCSPSSTIVKYSNPYVTASYDSMKMWCLVSSLTPGTIVKRGRTFLSHFLGIPIISSISSFLRGGYFTYPGQSPILPRGGELFIYLHHL